MRKPGPSGPLADQLGSSEAGTPQRTAGVAGLALATSGHTPELKRSQVVVGIGGGPSPQDQLLFPLFRSISQLKTLYIVRHAESEYNAAAAASKGFEDPHIFDPRLTACGRQQALGLRKRLALLPVPGDALWVSSPLSRALETFMLGCPLLPAPGAERDAAGGPGVGGGEGGLPVRLEVRSELSEHVYTCGDVGTPATHLRQRFPLLGGCMASLAEVWWFSPSGKPNCALRGVLSARESMASVKLRCGAFRRWLLGRDEKVIVAIGHSTFWKVFSQSKQRMRNCEVVELHV